MKNSKDDMIRNRMRERQTVLLVDDSENDMFLMRMAFERADFNVELTEAHNGDEAIAYLSGEGAFADRFTYPLPALMLLDLHLPHKDGFEVLAWARGRASLAGMSIVVMTASTRQEDVKRAFDLGASSYLVKPLDIDDLVKMVSCMEQWSRMNYFPPQSRI
jgi:DNA-binding response OmpR family regulator